MPEQSLFSLYQEYSGVLREQGKLEEAAAALKEGLERVPLGANRSVLYCTLASILCDLGRGDEANSILRDGIERIQQPQAGYLITALANNLRLAGDYEAANAELRRGIERWPGLYKPYVILSINLRAQGKLGEAEDVLLAAMSKVPTKQVGSLHLALAQLWEQRGDFGKAQDNYEKSIGVTYHPVSCAIYARFLWRLGQTEQASEMFELALSQRSIRGAFWPLVYRSYAVFLLHTDKQDRASQVLAEGFGLQADSAEIDGMMSELSAITIEQIITSAEKELLAAESEEVPWELQVESLIVEPAAEAAERVGVLRIAVVPSEPMPAAAPSPIVNILHISDIHRGPDAPTSHRTLRGKLLDDIRRTYDEDSAKLEPDEPRLGPPDVIVLSGDLTQHADPAEYDLAREFLEELLELVGGERERVVLVPGNHDVNLKLSRECYVPATEQEFEDQPRYDEPYRQMVKKERDAKVYWRKIEETYTERFKPFKTLFDDFYRGTAAAYTYPLDRDWMYTVYDYSRMYGLVIVGFNTCDEIDHLDRRAFINTDAIYRAEDDSAFRAGEGGLVRIAVFHHNIRSVQHGEDFLDPKYLQILKRHGFDLCLHGHVHTAGLDVFDPTQAKTLPVLGAGSLAAPYKDRPPAAPKGYNLIVINRESGGIFAHTRCHDEDHLVWKADYRWDGKPYLTVRPPASGNTTD